MSQKSNRSELFFREPIFKIAELIFNYPNKKFHIRLLGKETGFSTTAVNKASGELNKLKIVRIQETPITKNITANLDSENFRFYKQIFNLYRLKKYGLISELTNMFNNPETVVLFGSYARGEDIEQSDIDLLVISPQDKIQEINRIKPKYEKKFNRKLNVHVLKSLEKSSKEFKNAAANGIILHGYLKVIS